MKITTDKLFVHLYLLIFSRPSLLVEILEIALIFSPNKKMYPYRYQPQAYYDMSTEEEYWDPSLAYGEPLDNYLPRRRAYNQRGFIDPLPQSPQPHVAQGPTMVRNVRNIVYQQPPIYYQPQVVQPPTPVMYQHPPTTESNQQQWLSKEQQQVYYQQQANQQQESVIRIVVDSNNQQVLGTVSSTGGVAQGSTTVGQEKQKIIQITEDNLPQPPVYEKIELSQAQIAKIHEIDIDIGEATKLIGDLRRYFQVPMLFDGSSELPLVAFYFAEKDKIPRLLQNVSVQTSVVDGYRIIQVPISEIRKTLQL